MGLFEYKGRRAGEAVLGRLEAPSSEAVAGQLASLGITPIEILPVREADDVLGSLRHRLKRGRVGIDDLIVFSRQMHSMSRAGLPILRGLRAIAETNPNPALVEVLHDIADSLEGGHELAVSLRRHPEVFPSLFVSTVKMGEETGRLEEAFAQLTGYLEIDRDTRKRIKAATRYPVMVIVGIAIAMVILNVFALPVFAYIFAEFGAELPWATRLLIATSDFSVAYWPHMAVGSFLFLIGIAFYLRTEGGQLRWSRARLRLPVVGSILERATLARFARTFSLSIRSGVTMLDALRIAAEVVDNAYLSGRILGLRENIERGDSLTRTATASGLFTPLVLQMMSVGEETGSLDELLLEAAIFYEGEVDYELKRISELIEPILIVGIGALVLLLALGVYLPMWDLAGAARG